MTTAAVIVKETLRKCSSEPLHPTQGTSLKTVSGASAATPPSRRPPISKCVLSLDGYNYVIGTSTSTFLPLQHYLNYMKWNVVVYWKWNWVALIFFNATGLEIANGNEGLRWKLFFPLLAIVVEKIMTFTATLLAAFFRPIKLVIRYVAGNLETLQATTGLLLWEYHRVAKNSKWCRKKPKLESIGRRIHRWFVLGWRKTLDWSELERSTRTALILDHGHFNRSNSPTLWFIFVPINLFNGNYVATVSWWIMIESSLSCKTFPRFPLILSLSLSLFSLSSNARGLSTVDLARRSHTFLIKTPSTLLSSPSRFITTFWFHYESKELHWFHCSSNLFNVIASGRKESYFETFQKLINNGPSYRFSFC